jgi:hypothetical protein
LAPKSPPDTPPRTPSPSISIERPLTPQTPGLSPASTPTLVMNIQNDRSSLVSPACSTSSKASSVDSHCSKQKSGKSGRSKHKANNAIPGLTASYNGPVSQTFANNSHSFNWENTVYNNTNDSINFKQHLLNSSKSSPQIPYNSYQIPFPVQRNGKSTQNYPNVTNLLNSQNLKSNQTISSLINCNYPSIESNQKHSSYSNAVPVDYQCLPPNDCNPIEAKHLSVGSNGLIGTTSYSGGAIHMNSNHSNSYRSQMNGHFGQQQQKLLRPSRLDAVLTKKDFTSPEMTPLYETAQRY